MMKLLKLFDRKMPMIMQVENVECGLACIAMISGYYGGITELAHLRNRFSISLKGVSISQLMRVASRLGYNARPLKVGMNSLEKLRAPCILHWGLNHYVVLVSVKRGYLSIHDPALGRRLISKEEASNYITGIAIELEPTTEFSSIPKTKKLKVFDLTKSFLGFKRAGLQIFLLSLVLEVFTIVGPTYLQLIMDQVFISNDLDFLFLIGVGFFAITIFKTLAAIARAWAITSLGTLINTHWSDNAFRHLMRLPLSWFERRYVGDIVSRFTSLKFIQETLTTQFISIMLDGLLSVLTIALLMMYSSTLLLIPAAAYVFYAVTRLFFLPTLMGLNRAYIASYAKQYGDLVESIRGALTIKLNNTQDGRASKFSSHVVETSNNELKSKFLDEFFRIYRDLIFGMARILIIWVGALKVLDNEITVGILVAVIAYTEMLIMRAANLLDKFIEFKMLDSHLERVSDILLAEPERVQDAGVNTDNLESVLEIDNVSYRYDSEGPWILKGLNLKVRAGESLAIYGASGGGKTTLAKLILGLIEQNDGEIKYGGIPLKKIGISSFRDVVGAVMQGDQLFAGTIADNISFFSGSYNLDEIINAAKSADIHDDITQMSLGYFTPVGDMGAALSGGQKQRVILARALYRKPKILVLDEATSHLDIDSERRVSNAIRNLNITRIIIAHRVETIKSATRAICLENGCFLPQGL